MKKKSKKNRLKKDKIKKIKIKNTIVIQGFDLINDNSSDFFFSSWKISFDVKIQLSRFARIANSAIATFTINN